MAGRVPNVALRSWLDVLGWSPQRLANKLTAYCQDNGVDLTVSGKAPYHWLNGARPRTPIPSLIATLLTEATGDQVTPSDLGWSIPDETAVVPADHGLDELWSPMTGLSVLRQAVRTDRAVENRRTYTGVRGTMLVVAAHHWLLDVERLAPVGSGRQVDPAVVDALEQVVEARCRMKDTLSGGAMHHLVREDLWSVIELLDNGSWTEAIGGRLYSLAAKFARLIGWVSMDSDDHGRAQRYLLLALRAAQLSGNRAVGANVLWCMATQALASGRPHDAITLLNSAYAGASAVMSAASRSAVQALLARTQGCAGEAALEPVVSGVTGPL